MRRVILVGLLCMGCTRDNPAFDGRPLADDGTGEQGDGDGDGNGDGDGDGDGDPDTTVGTSDLPPDPSVCEFEPSDGLSLRVGGPDDYGGQCATGVNMGMQVVSVNGGEMVVEVCEHGCEPCFGTMLTISTYPLQLEGHVQMTPGECMSLEAHGALVVEPGACYFGALTIYEFNPLTPYVIATTHSHQPTALGAAMLGDSIPAPLEAGNCNCDDVGQSNECCYTAPGPPEFWYYPLEGGQLFPGGKEPLSVPNQLGLAHSLKVFQAQLLHSCESHDLQLSWAVLAQL